MYRILALFLPLLLCGFLGDGDKPENPEKKPPLPQLDTTDVTIRGYTEGTDKAPWFIALHSDPKAGQYWEVGSDSFEIQTSTRWQVTQVSDETALIEQRIKLDAEMFKSDYVIAYRVDLSPEEGEPMITRAWIAEPGRKPQRIKVSEMPAKDPAKKAEKPDDKADPEDEGEAFKDLELAGGVWAGKLFTRKFDDMTTKLWVAETGWFDKVVKTTAGDDYEQKLQAFGYDATALLIWPEKWEDADEPEQPESPQD